jgi:hypothetical protein
MKKLNTMVMLLIIAIVFAVATGNVMAVSESDSLFTTAGTEITALSGNVKVMLGLALAPILLFLGWKYFKRAKSAA